MRAASLALLLGCAAAHSLPAAQSPAHDSAAASTRYARVLDSFREARALRIEGTVRATRDDGENKRFAGQGTFALEMVRPLRGELRMELQDAGEGPLRSTSFLATGRQTFLLDHESRTSLDLSGDTSPLDQFLDLDPFHAWQGREVPSPARLEPLQHSAEHPELSGLALERGEIRQEWWLDAEDRLAAASVIPRGRSGNARPRLDFRFSLVDLQRQADPALFTAAVPAGYRAPGSAVPPGPEPVELETADGVTIHGWYIHAGEHEGEREDLARVPAVVLLHMVNSDKRAWEPLIGPFRSQGIALLMIDLRGHGESRTGPDGKDWSGRVRERDPELFRGMHQDAAAAVAWLEERGHEIGRIGLLGASVGCSVAIDACVRDPRLRVAGVLTPGENYLGVPTMEHVEKWGDRELLIVSSEEEAEKGAAPIRDHLSRKEESRVTLWLLPEKAVHGTRMFGKVEGIETRLADWFAGRLSR